MRKIPAAEFKARCLAILDEVARSGETITILKRGKPVARLSPATGAPESRYPQDDLHGSVRVLGDIIAPVLPAESWEAEAAGKP